MAARGAGVHAAHVARELARRFPLNAFLVLGKCRPTPRAPRSRTLDLPRDLTLPPLRREQWRAAVVGCAGRRALDAIAARRGAGAGGAAPAAAARAARRLASTRYCVATATFVSSLPEKETVGRIAFT